MSGNYTETREIRLSGTARGAIAIEVKSLNSDVTANSQDRSPLEALAGDLAVSEERYRTLFETMPMGIVHYDADGSVIGANKAAGDILGIDLSGATTWPVVPEGQAVSEDGSPFPREELPVLTALRTGQVVAGTPVGVRHAKTGELRWVRDTAVPDARDEHDRPSRAYAIFTDLTEQRRTEAELRQSTALLGRLREGNVLGVVVASEHQVYEANDAYLDIIGYAREDLEAERVTWREISLPEWSDVQDKAMGQLQRTRVCQPFEKEYVHKDGHPGASAHRVGVVQP
jgi:PAS domain S-box-containing protein